MKAGERQLALMGRTLADPSTVADKFPMAAIHSRQLLPMLTTSTEPFDDPGYLFAVKWRGLATVEDSGVRLWGREGAD
jgi:hypothetical protein